MDDDGSGAADMLRREAEWTRLQSQFTTAGYRDGVLGGKDLALQEGFNDGFHVGAGTGLLTGQLLGLLNAALTFAKAVQPAAVSADDLDRLCAPAMDALRSIPLQRSADALAKDAEAVPKSLRPSAPAAAPAAPAAGAAAPAEPELSELSTAAALVAEALKQLNEVVPGSVPDALVATAAATLQEHRPASLGKAPPSPTAVAGVAEPPHVAGASVGAGVGAGAS